MSNILDLIDEPMDGNAWEDLCVKCYRLRYQSDHYRLIPAANGGDAGIEGFTQSGIVHQCYYPERNYDDDKLYNHQRDKATHDIQKLLDNGERLKKLGVPIITEWHFNIPQYKDSRILQHLAAKNREVLDARKKDPQKYDYISPKFQIIPKVADDFIPEISQIIRRNINNSKIELSSAVSDPPDWSQCDSQKAANIRRKITAVMHTSDGDADTSFIVDMFIKAYIQGIEQMQELRIQFPEIHHELYSLAQSSKTEVSLRTHMNTDRSLNNEVFSEILKSFQEKLEKNFSNVLTPSSITDLKHDLIATWLADCSMEFRS